MELILRNKECFLISIPEIMDYAVQDELDMKWLNTIEQNMVLEATGVTDHKNTVTPFGERKLMNSSVVEDGKENFLMPAPRGRPPRNRKTKSTIGDRRMLTDAELSVTEPTKSRRTTRKGKEKPAPRSSRTTRASTRTSYKCRPSVSGARISNGQKTKKKTSVLDDSVTSGEKRMTRSKVRSVSVIKSSFLEVGEIVEKKRTTKSKATNLSMFVETETLNVVSVAKVLTSPAPNKNALLAQSPAVLFSPYAPNSVKQRVEAFEEFTSTLAPDSSKAKKIDSVPSTVGKQTLSSIISPVLKRIKPKLDSPMIKSKSKFAKKKVSPLLENSPKVNQTPEANDNSVIEDEMEVLENNTIQVGDNCDGAMEIDEEEVSEANQAKKAEEAENEADDEWMSDDDHDEKKESSVKKNNRLFSHTPKAVKPVELKIVEAAVGSYKALRSRKVQNASLDLPLALKSKSSHVANNVTSVTPIQQQKPVEIEVKEAELKRKMEKEVEAVKRKEEIMKKRTEAAKRKREEKMAKVKRTREEREKEHKVLKAKVRKEREEKKKPVESPEPELEPVKSLLPKVPTPHGDFNVTFEVKVKEEHNVDAYNLTPCWQDRPPVQPDNPNDYGVVDKSDCSSEEDNDPRKKIPVWAQLKPDDRKLLSQALLPHSFINEYWHCKPRAPTIKEFFGSQVSKRTLKRGLNYRTSSACWNTPPSRKLGL